MGSDGVQACASCHFRAGADPRSINQLNPGGADNPDPTINLGGPNYQLKASDFPFHKLADPTDRHSAVLQDIDDVSSSQGVHFRQFVGAEPGARERHRDADSRSRLQHRRHQHASSGAAQHADDDQCRVQLQQFLGPARAQHFQRSQRARRRRLRGARAARDGSQSYRARHRTHRQRQPGVAGRRSAAERPRNGIASAAPSRTSASASRPAVPLPQQEVSPSDSVLGPYANVHDRHGLKTRYRELIETAFEPAWWRSNLIVSVAGDGSLTFVPRPNRPLHENEYTMLEYNFALYFGLSVQLYEMTLISDDAPVDRYFEGDRHALTDQELRGMEVFTGDSSCSGCQSARSSPTTPPAFCSVRSWTA